MKEMKTKKLYPKEKFSFFNNSDGSKSEPKEGDIYFNKERRFLESGVLYFVCIRFLEVLPETGTLED